MKPGRWFDYAWIRWTSRRDISDRRAEVSPEKLESRRSLLLPKSGFTTLGCVKANLQVVESNSALRARLVPEDIARLLPRPRGRCRIAPGNLNSLSS